MVDKKIIIIIILIIIIVFLLFFKINKKNNKKNNNIYTPKFINFNSSWCKWSKSLNPIWNKLVKIMENKNIKILNIKCDLEENENLCNKYKIIEYPTLKLVLNNNIIEYDGDPNLDDLINFIESNVTY